MNTFEQAQTFFFVSSVGFITLWILVAVFLFYLIRATKAFSEIMDKIENDIEQIGDTTKEMVEDMRHSVIFNFLFRKKKKHKKD
ncbi:MAG: hypothetical protein WCI76_03480 [bacterium]